MFKSCFHTGLRWNKHPIEAGWMSFGGMGWDECSSPQLTSKNPQCPSLWLTTKESLLSSGNINNEALNLNGFNSSATDYAKPGGVFLPALSTQNKQCSTQRAWLNRLNVTCWFNSHLRLKRLCNNMHNLHGSWLSNSGRRDVFPPRYLAQYSVL